MRTTIRALTVVLLIPPAGEQPRVRFSRPRR